MKKSDEQAKRKLVLERFRAGDAAKAAGDVPVAALERLAREDVATVFIISTEAVDAGEYLDLVQRYENEGFRVRNIHVERLDEHALPGVRKVVEEIRDTFRRESCLVLSYGRSLAPLMVACYYVLSGSSPSRAISRIKELDDGFVTRSDEVAFVYRFKQFLNVARGEDDDDYIFQPLPEEYTPVEAGPVAFRVPSWLSERGLVAEPPPPVTDVDTAVVPGGETEPVPEPHPSMEHETAPLPERGTEAIPVPPSPEGAEPALTLDELIVERPLTGRAMGGPGPEESGRDILVTADEGPRVDQAAAPVIAMPGARDAEREVSQPAAVGPSSMKEAPAVTEKPEIAKAPAGAGQTALPPKPEARIEAPVKRIPAGEAAGEHLGVYSIRFKLVSIISGIIIVALTGMILLATYFFKRDNELRAWENNQKFSEVTALKVKSDFLSIIERSRIIPGVIDRLDLEGRAALWENDEDFLFIGIAAQGGGGGLRFIRAVYNRGLMEKSGIGEADIQAAHAAYGKSFAPSFNGEIAVHNISQSMRTPVTGFSLPLYRDARGATDRILVSYIRLDRLLKTFRASGIVSVFMVNDRGDIIAHPDASMILSGGNYLNLPIVKMMMKSRLDNGQLRYDDESGEPHLGAYKKIGVGGCGVIATVRESLAYEQVYRIQRWNLYLLVVILTIAILVVYIYGKKMTSPISRLVSATTRIKEGDYLVDIRPSARDEIGLLTSSFVEMGQGLAEREKMKEAFGKFVNKEIAERVLKGEIQLGGERKDVAIFFSDIRNFTAMSEKLEPEEVVEFLNDYMSRMVKCVNDTRGVVDKYIGDAIMAVWGAPVSTGNDTGNAVEAALAMRRELLAFNAGRGGDRKPVIKIGCGINTGPVLAGQIGSEDRMEYTVIGDPVNLASRIETLNKPFGTDILLSEDSYRIVKDTYRFEPMQQITVKGKAEPQQIYAVLGRKDDPDAPKSIDELRALLGTKEQPFRRRREDLPEEEVKYEILEK